MSYYQEAIRETLALSGHVGKYDPRHIEGWMRLECSTLDGLDRRRFAKEIEIARQCVDAGPLADSETLAKSYGL